MDLHSNPVETAICAIVRMVGIAEAAKLDRGALAPVVPIGERFTVRAESMAGSIPCFRIYDTGQYVDTLRTRSGAQIRADELNGGRSYVDPYQRSVGQRVQPIAA